MSFKPNPNCKFIITDHGEMFQCLYEDKVLLKSVKTGLYSANSLFSFSDNPREDVNRFIISNQFTLITKLYDNSIETPEFIFLYETNDVLRIGISLEELVINIVKQSIGFFSGSKGFDLYYSEIYKKLKKVEFVTNPKECLEEMNKKLSNKFKVNIKDGIPKINNEALIEKMFSSITKKYKTEKVTNNNIKYVPSTCSQGSGYYIEPSIAPMVISMISQLSISQAQSIVNSFEEYYKTLDKNNITSEFILGNDKYLYLRHNEMVLVMNVSKDLVNVSRLLKSLSKEYNLNFSLSSAMRDPILVSILKNESLADILRDESIAYEKEGVINGKYVSYEIVNIIIEEISLNNNIEMNKDILEVIELNKSIFNEIYGKYMEARKRAFEILDSEREKLNIILERREQRKIKKLQPTRKYKKANKDEGDLVKSLKDSLNGVVEEKPKEKSKRGRKPKTLLDELKETKPKRKYVKKNKKPTSKRVSKKASKKEATKVEAPKEEIKEEIIQETPQNEIIQEEVNKEIPQEEIIQEAFQEEIEEESKEESKDESLQENNEEEQLEESFQEESNEEAFQESLQNESENEIPVNELKDSNPFLSSLDD